MKSYLHAIVWLLISVTGAAAAPEVIPGCQGEGCGCFRGYQSATPGTRPPDHEIATIRSFTLYKNRSAASQLLGKFKAGTKARPLGQELLVEVKGEYIVELIQDKNLPFKTGDRIDTIINEGEGTARGRINGKWVDFDFQSVQLKTVKETVISEWMSVRVNGIAGFTLEQPFEGCLE